MYSVSYVDSFSGNKQGNLPVFLLSKVLCKMFVMIQGCSDAHHLQSSTKLLRHIWINLKYIWRNKYFRLFSELHFDISYNLTVSYTLDLTSLTSKCAITSVMPSTGFFQNYNFLLIFKLLTCPRPPGRPLPGLGSTQLQRCQLAGTPPCIMVRMLSQIVAIWYCTVLHCAMLYYSYQLRIAAL